MSSIKTTQIDGDVSVGRNVSLGGKAEIAGSAHIGHNLKVDGWLEAPNIKGANKGVFLTVQALREAYPNPHDGWMAGVGASTPFTAYIGNGGDWVATGGTIEVTVDMSQYTEGVAQLQEDIDEVAARVQTAETNITSHTQQLTTLGNQLNNVQNTANAADSRSQTNAQTIAQHTLDIAAAVGRIGTAEDKIAALEEAVGENEAYYRLTIENGYIDENGQEQAQQFDPPSGDGQQIVSDMQVRTPLIALPNGKYRIEVTNGTSIYLCRYKNGTFVDKISITSPYTFNISSLAQELGSADYNQIRLTYTRPALMIFAREDGALLYSNVGNLLTILDNTKADQKEFEALEAEVMAPIEIVLCEEAGKLSGSGAEESWEPTGQLGEAAHARTRLLRLSAGTYSVTASNVLSGWLYKYSGKTFVNRAELTPGSALQITVPERGFMPIGGESFDGIRVYVTYSGSVLSGMEHRIVLGGNRDLLLQAVEYDSGSQDKRIEALESSVEDAANAHYRDGGTEVVNVAPDDRQGEPERDRLEVRSPFGGEVLRVGRNDDGYDMKFCLSKGWSGFDASDGTILPADDSEEEYASSENALITVNDDGDEHYKYTLGDGFGGKIITRDSDDDNLKIGLPDGSNIGSEYLSLRRSEPFLLYSDRGFRFLVDNNLLPGRAALDGGSFSLSNFMLSIHSMLSNNASEYPWSMGLTEEAFHVRNASGSIEISSSGIIKLTRDSGRLSVSDSAVKVESLPFQVRGGTLSVYNALGSSKVVEAKPSGKLWASGVIESDTGFHGKWLDAVVGITYSDLVTLRNNSGLIPGAWYRITDYTATTTQAETQAAGNKFDILVHATAENKLSESAKAIQHEGDTYFADSKLEAWELKYCLDNDTDRFAWADTVNGKGVIWYMKDEYNNECPYDFKNIMFARYKITDCPNYPDIADSYAINNKAETGITVNQTAIYCYTFSMIDIYESTVADVSTVQNKYPSDESAYFKVYSNVIKPYVVRIEDVQTGDGKYPMSLPNNVFVTDTDLCDIDSSYSSGEYYGYHSNTLGTDSHDNTFGNNCHANTFGDECRFNTLYCVCLNNTFGDLCWSNVLGEDCGCNILGYKCEGNFFCGGCHQNTFGGYCRGNILGNTFLYNNLGTGCCDNVFENGCGNNSLGLECRQNTFGARFSNNTLGNSCYSNRFRGEDIESTILGDGCSNNLFRGTCERNVLGHRCDGNSFEEDSSGNILGNDCSGNEIGNECSENILGDHCSDNTFVGSGCEQNVLGYNCRDNYFYEECTGNTLGDNSRNNSFYPSCYKNTLKESCENNVMKDGCYDNTLERNCSVCSLGENSYNNTIGNGCKNIRFGNSSSVKSYYRNIIIENGNQYIYLDCSVTTSFARMCQNVLIGLGVNNTTTYKTLTVAAGNTFKTTFKTVGDVEQNV